MYRDEAGDKIIPQGKEDIFADTTLSLVQKRLLMKFLNLISMHVSMQSPLDLDSEPYVLPFSYPSSLFVDFLDKHLQSNQEFISLVMNGLLVCVENKANLATRDGIAAIAAYVSSVGRFGTPTAFLCNIYGLAGELCQAFCRYQIFPLCLDTLL